MGLVCRGGDGDGHGAPGVCVTELVGEVLYLISRQPIVIPETPLVGWSGCSLDTLVRAEVEVILCGVGDVGIHGGASRDITRPAGLVPVV